MVKQKKGKKDQAREESAADATDEQLDVDVDEDAPKTKAGGDKKKKNKSAKVDQDDGSEDESAVITITKDVKNLKIANKSKKGKKKDSDDENDDLPVSKSKKKSGFDLLMMDDDDNDDEEQPVQATELDEDEDNEKPNKRQNKKGKKSKKKRNDSDDEDIDKVLAELESEYAGGKKPEVVAAVDPDELAEEFNEKKNKKGKKQAAKETQPETADVEDEPADDEEAGGGLKTAAQKKKEKKERQKREAALLKQQQHTQTSEAPNEDGETAEVPAPKASKASKKIKEVKEEPKPEGVVEPAAEQPEEEKDDKKKKKKKTKAEIAAEKEEKEREKKKTGGLSKSVVAAMQERVKKMKEEEEKLRQEEEDRIAREEEMETARLERIRLEAEKKEKKKQKEAERKARLKAEGKLLTPKQKLDRARAQAMLDALRAQGAELPEVGEKRVRPGTRIRPNRKKDQQQANGVEDGKEESGENKDATTDQQKDDKIEEPVEVIKEAWDESSSSEEDEGEEESQEKDEDDEESESGDESDGSDDDSDDSDEDDEDDHRNEVEDKRERALLRIQKRRHDAELKRTVDNLRAAVVCVLGHVDTGKTKILDKLRRTNVQDGEAGGITQQIGATNVPIENIKEQCRIVKGSNDTVYRLPGLLIIDTPGHESFSNLRNRGSSLCDIAILVVDIMHGLEPQTIESLNLLKAKKTPFIVALNKIDRLYDWQTMSRKDVRDILRLQAANTQLEFKQRSKEVILQFAEQGLNAALFHENEDPKTYISMVPTSAITGEGMGNLLHLIVENCQNMLAKRLMYSEELQATVLEVKAIPGLGTTIDAILINGRLREGDTMILAGTEGPIVTQIRSLLMPQPMKELRVKNAYVEYKEIMAAQGVKIAAKELEKAIAGLNLQIAQKPDETEICREEVAKDLRSVLNSIKLTERGVYVQASTLGSLEALIEFLKTSKIPYAGIRIGPVVKRDVMKASTMLVHDPTFATILAFDVKIERDAQDMADSLGVKIFQADIIYHLFDKFIAYKDELLKKKRDEFRSIAVFPCKMKILPNFIFNSRDPIVMGVMIENGIVKEGTPICVPSKEFVDIGIVTSIELNHKQIDSARKGQEVCIKIEPIPGESPKMFGRHFDETDMLTSKISRQSIDACKDYFRDDLLKADWALMVELKKLFQIL